MPVTTESAGSQLCAGPPMISVRCSVVVWCSVFAFSRAIGDPRFVVLHEFGENYLLYHSIVYIYYCQLSPWTSVLCPWTPPSSVDSRFSTSRRCEDRSGLGQVGTHQFWRVLCLVHEPRTRNLRMLRGRVERLRQPMATRAVGWPVGFGAERQLLGLKLQSDFFRILFV